MIISEMSENSVVEEWQFRGIKKHHIMQFPIIKNKRRETLEETLNGLSAEEANYSLFPRTTHLYKTDLKALKQILAEIKGNDNFISSSIIHSSSDLGLTHKIQAEHRNGATLLFDGLYIRVTRVITADTFNLGNLLQITGIPRDENDIINDFISCVHGIFPKENIFGHSQYKYYTVDETNWEKLGLRREGNAQLCLIINNPKYFTITALIFAKMGKDFPVHLGDEDRIHQMIAHDFFMLQEIEEFIPFYDIKLKDIVKHQNKLKIDFGGLMSPIWRIDNKHEMWNSVKDALKSLYAIKDLTDKGKLLTRAIENIIENKWAFFNGPRQIWIAGEEMDHEEKIQHPTTQFFEIRLEGSGFKELPDSATNPFYQETFQKLSKKVGYVSALADEIYQREKDLLSAYQTEFALYAVWFSLIALLIAIFSLILNLII